MAGGRRRVVLACALTAALVFPTAQADPAVTPAACTRTWLLPIGGPFTNPLAWLPPGAPGSSDVACIEQPVSVTGATGVGVLRVGPGATVAVATDAQIGAIENDGTTIINHGVTLTGDLRSSGSLRMAFEPVQGADYVLLNGGSLLSTGALDIGAAAELRIEGSGAADAVLDGATAIANLTHVEVPAELRGQINLTGTLDLQARTVLAGSIGPNVPQARGQLAFEPTFAGEVNVEGTVVVEGVLPATATLNVRASYPSGALATNWPGSGAGLPFTNRGTINIEGDAYNGLDGALEIVSSCPTEGQCTPAPFSNEGTIRLGKPGYNPARLFAELDNGGRLEVAAAVSALLEGGVHHNRGTIDIADGSVLRVRSDLTMDSGSVTGRGTLDVPNLRGVGLVEPRTELGGNEQAGVLSPGFSPERIEFASDLVLDSGDTTVIELAGTTPGTEHDQLVVGGAANLAGTLDVQLLKGYVPQPCDDFHIVDASEVAGSFGTMVGLDVPGPLDLVPVTDGTGLHLVAVDPKVGVTVADPSIVVDEGGVPVAAKMCLSYPPFAPVQLEAVAPGTVIPTAVTTSQRPLVLEVSAIDDDIDAPDRVVDAQGTTNSTDLDADGLGFGFSITIIDNDLTVVQPPTPPAVPDALPPATPTPTPPAPEPPPEPLPVPASPEPAPASTPSVSAPDRPTSVLAAETERQVPALERRAALPAAVPTPSSVQLDAPDLLRSGALWLLLILLLLFPSQLLNSTIEENYDEITGRLDRIRSWWRSGRARLPQMSSAARAATAVVAAGVLDVWLDPGAELVDRTTTSTAIGLVVAFSVVLAAYELPQRLLLDRAGSSGQFRAYPVAALAAVACVVLTRITGFQPGYLFGLIAGYTFRDVTAEREGRAIAVSASVLLAVAVSAWLLWIPVADAAQEPDPSFLVQVLDVALVATFVAGIESMMFSLVPVRFLDGEKLWRWDRRVWLALCGTSLFLFVHVLIGGTDYVDKSDTVSAVAVSCAFIGFGAFSVAFWWYWRRRSSSSPPQPASRVHAQQG